MLKCLELTSSATREARRLPATTLHLSQYDSTNPSKTPSTYGSATAMTVLSFSLSPIATGHIYDALICLAKFGEAVSIEAKGEKVCIKSKLETLPAR